MHPNLLSTILVETLDRTIPSLTWKVLSSKKSKSMVVASEQAVSLSDFLKVSEALSKAKVLGGSGVNFDGKACVRLSPWAVPEKGVLPVLEVPEGFAVRTISRISRVKNVSVSPLCPPSEPRSPRGRSSLQGARTACNLG